MLPANMPTSHRRLSLLDRTIVEIDRALHHIFCEPQQSRAYPAAEAANNALSTEEKRLSASLMRVNHAGEVAAQALYQGQSITARDAPLRARLRQASIEESDHLAWCRRRLRELHDRPSLLDPLWYLGSLGIGITAGIAGDRWNLGFLAETERQVVAHLESHLQRLPDKDERGRKIIAQMRTDELGHAHLAEELGAADLPQPIKDAMRLLAKIMTTVAERI